MPYTVRVKLCQDGSTYTGPTNARFGIFLSHSFAYWGHFSSGQCGAMVTLERDYDPMLQLGSWVSLAGGVGEITIDVLTVWQQLYGALPIPECTGFEYPPGEACALLLDTWLVFDPLGDGSDTCTPVHFVTGGFGGTPIMRANAQTVGYACQWTEPTQTLEYVACTPAPMGQVTRCNNEAAAFCTITLLLDGNVLASDETDANGNYDLRQQALLAVCNDTGRYTARLTCNSVSCETTLQIQTTFVSGNACSLCGSQFDDLDIYVGTGSMRGNVRDCAHGGVLSGVTVELLDGAEVKCSGTTDASGNYNVCCGVPSGNYTLRFTLSGCTTKEISVALTACQVNVYNACLECGTTTPEPDSIDQILTADGKTRAFYTNDSGDLVMRTYS